jgi:fused signal recognition particle receptor
MEWGGVGKRLRELLASREPAEGLFEELEDAMIEADMGVKTASELADSLRALSREKRLRSRADMVAHLKATVGADLKSAVIDVPRGELTLLLVLGVNGVGKTTTIAKLARHFREVRGIEKILLAAGDTFRAGAVEQLKLHGARLGIPVIAQEQGADPGAVIFDAISSAAARGSELLIADTAGRLHNKEGLVKELMKIDKIIKARLAGGNYRRVLVLDATTGQNSFQQSEVFHKAVGVDSIVLAKFDSTAKGGMVVPICRELGIPFSFVGLGEKLEDISPFDPREYLDSLFGDS